MDGCAGPAKANVLLAMVARFGESEIAPRVKVATMTDRLEVLCPSGRMVGDAVADTGLVADLNGKRVAFVWDYLFKGDRMWAVIGQQLRRHWPGVTLVGPETFGNIHGPDERDVVDGLPKRLDDARADAAIVGVGACGSCTPAVIRALAVCERAGVPSVALVASGFVSQARIVANSLGLGVPRLAIYPGVILTDDDATVDAKADDHLAPAVLAGLTGAQAAAKSPQHPSGATAASQADLPADDYSPGIAFTGSYDEVIDHFEDMLWSDGLPIVPPTPERVEAALRYVKRSPDEVIGVLAPANREATVLNVAVNGVMAGCRPEYMPILVAAVEAIAEPRFRLEDFGCTAGWETLVVVSSPDAERLGFNSKQGALRAGARANTSVGRFLRLFTRNVAGVRIPPGVTDKATLGSNFRVALAEDEQAVRGLGWPTLREELGYAQPDTVVLVQSVVGSSLPIYSGGDDPDGHLDIIAEHIAGTSGHYSFLGLRGREWWPVLVMSPAVARVFAAAGLGKADIRAELADRARIPASVYRRYPAHTGVQDFDVDKIIAAGWPGAAYVESDDPDRMIPTIPRPDCLAIIVAGDPDRNQSKYLVNNHNQGPRIAKRAQPA